MSGGTIFGNWATGRAAIVTAPTITVRIAMTIATIGRLMKNFDISPASLLFRRLVERPGVHTRTENSLLDALHNHSLARFQPIADHPHRPGLVADLDCLDTHRVVAIYCGHLIAALLFRDGRLRDE